MFLKQTAEMPCANAEPRGKRVDAVVIESAIIDQADCPLHSGA